MVKTSSAVLQVRHCICLVVFYLCIHLDGSLRPPSFALPGTAEESLRHAQVHAEGDDVLPQGYVSSIPFFFLLPPLPPLSVSLFVVLFSCPTLTTNIICHQIASHCTMKSSFLLIATLRDATQHNTTNQLTGSPFMYSLGDIMDSYCEYFEEADLWSGRC